MNTREKILYNFQETAKRKGFYSIQMQEIADMSGISKRTIYRYFRNKEEIIDETINLFMQRVAEFVNITLDEKSDIDVFKDIVNFIGTEGQFILNPLTMNDLRQYYPHLWHKIEAFRAKRVKLIINKLFADINEDTNLDLRIASRIFIASIEAVINPEFLLENNLSFNEATEQISHILLQGMLPRNM